MESPWFTVAAIIISMGSVIATAISHKGSARKTHIEMLEYQITILKNNISELKSQLTLCEQRCDDLLKEKIKLLQTLLKNENKSN